jgi:hypothetical protein
VGFQIASGHSFGVVDTQYQYRTPEAAAAGGAVLWDRNAIDATAEQLDEQIDSPLVSIALSYDDFHHMPEEFVAPVIEILPLFGAIYARFAILEPRDLSKMEATDFGQHLMRNGTSTRLSSEGKGIMKKTTNWLIEYAKAHGFRTITLEAFNEAVNHVWTNPSADVLRVDRTCAFHTTDYTEVDADGRIINPFGSAKTGVSRIVVTLQE